MDAAALSRNDISMLFLLVGSGADCERLRRRAAEMKLQNVKFLPLLDQWDFRGLLAASNICLVTQQQSVSEIAFPSKVVTYLAAGRPILASVNPDCEVAKVVYESGAGRVVGAEEPEALSFTLQEMRGEDSSKFGKNARRYASLRWSSVRVLGQLERSLLAVAGSALSPVI